MCQNPLNEHNRQHGQPAVGGYLQLALRPTPAAIASRPRSPMSGSGLLVRGSSPVVPSARGSAALRDGTPRSRRSVRASAPGSLLSLWYDDAAHSLMPASVVIESAFASELPSLALQPRTLILPPTLGICCVQF